MDPKHDHKGPYRREAEVDLTRRRRWDRCKEEWSQRDRHRALKLEEGATSRGMQAAPGSWKRQGDGFSPGDSGGGRHGSADILIAAH